MRAALLAVLALLALPAFALPAGSGEPQGVPLSHGDFVPLMHLAALNIPEGIRPGAWVQVGGAECTTSFVLRDAAGALYITTAAHCTGFNGQRAALTHNTLVAATAEPMEFGTVVARWPSGLDAALIRIDADKYDLVNPTMIGWGGPTGLATGALAAGTETLHHGWGWATWYEQQTRCRRGELVSASANVWWTRQIGGGGDSGSAIMLGDGRALGILDWGGGTIYRVPGSTAFASTQVGGVRLDAVLARWNAAGWGLSLVTGEPLNGYCKPEPALPVG